MSAIEVPAIPEIEEVAADKGPEIEAIPEREATSEKKATATPEATQSPDVAPAKPESPKKATGTKKTPTTPDGSREGSKRQQRSASNTASNKDDSLVVQL